MIAARVDFSMLAHAIDRFRTEYKLDINMILADQMRLACNDAIRKTPPGHPGASLAEQKRAGQGALESDVRNIVRDKDDIAATWPHPKDSNMEMVRTKSGSVFAVPKDGTPAKVTKAVIRAHHMVHRDARTGRVKGGGVRRRVGNVWYYPAIFAKKSTLGGYLREAKRHVGRLKAGWLPAAEHWARKCNGEVKAPAWVRKAGRGEGSASGKFSALIGVFRSRNAVPYAGYKISAGLIDAITRTREKDMAATGGRIPYALRRLDRTIAKFNATR